MYTDKKVFSFFFFPVVRQIIWCCYVGSCVVYTVYCCESKTISGVLCHTNPNTSWFFLFVAAEIFRSKLFWVVPPIWRHIRVCVCVTSHFVCVCVCVLAPKKRRKLSFNFYSTLLLIRETSTSALFLLLLYIKLKQKEDVLLYYIDTQIIKHKY